MGTIPTFWLIPVCVLLCSGSGIIGLQSPSLFLRVPFLQINGGYRSQGFVGQTSLPRSLIKTPMKGNAVRGHGGIDGTYPHNVNFTSDVTSINDSTTIKSCNEIP